MNLRVSLQVVAEDKPLATQTTVTVILPRYLDDPQQSPDGGGDEEHDVHIGDVLGALDQVRGDALKMEHGRT